MMRKVQSFCWMSLFCCANEIVFKKKKKSRSDQFVLKLIHREDDAAVRLSNCSPEYRRVFLLCVTCSYISEC